MMLIKKIALCLKKDNLAALMYFFVSLIHYMAIFKSDTTLSGRVGFHSYIGLFLCLCIFFVKLGKIKFDGIRIKLLIVIFLFALIISFNSFKGGVPPFLLFIYLIEFTFLDNKEWLFLYKLFRVFLVIQCAFGIVCYLSYTIGFGIPYEINEYYEPQNNALYVNYKVSYIYSCAKENAIRLCGLASEPGYFGKTIAFFLIADKFNLKRISNIILFIGMWFTWSFAAFLLCLLYFAIINYKKKLALVLSVVMVVSTYFLFVNIKIDDPVVSSFQERLDFNNNTNFENSRSSEDLLIIFEKQKNNLEDFMLGYGGGYSNSKNTGLSSSLIKLIIDYGLLGVLSTIGILFFIAYFYAKRYSLALVLCFVWLVSRYFTAEMFVPLVFVYLIGGITYIKSQDYTLNANILHHNSMCHLQK